MNIEQRVLLEYPYQIAETYRSYTNLKEEDYSSRILKLVEIFEILLKTLCAVNTKWFLESGIADRNLNEELEGFQRPSLGRWQALFREVCRAISSSYFVPPPPLVDAITQFYQARVPGGTESEVYAAYKNVSEMYGLEPNRKLSNGRLFERFGELRNKLMAHGALQALSRVESKDVADSLHTILHHLLQGCDFLCSYEVLYIETVSVKRGEFCYFAKVCRGSQINKEVLFHPEKTSEPIEDGELYVCSVDRESTSKPVITWALSLSPYFILASCTDCKRDQVFVFNGRKSNLLEYLSYQCAHFLDHVGGHYLDAFLQLLDPAKSNEQDSSIGKAAEAQAPEPYAEWYPTPGENQSARLRYAIEHKYPFPIAGPFYQLRLIDDWKAQIPQLANILVASLEHVAILALAEYLAGDARDSELNQRLVETFKKPISHGTWAGILRETMTFLRDHSAQLLTSELPALYFGKDKKQASTSIRIIGDELVAMRNDLIKKSVDTPPTHDQYQRFKQRLVEFLQVLAFVKDHPLIAVKVTKMKGGIKTHQCTMLVGCHEAFEQVDLRCDLDLQQMRIAMLNPETQELLYLYPFYLLRECPEVNCQSMHLFRFDRTERSRIEYVAAGGHRLSDQTAGADLHALLQGRWGAQPSLRQKANYLCLDFADSWQRRAAGERIAGKYEVVRHLRRGGMSDVYQVTEVNSEKPLALKLLPFQLLSDQKMIQRFRHEAMRIRKLDHANITRVFDYGEDLVDHYLVMEKADGWNIGEGRIALDVGELPKPLNETQVIAIIKQACEGLDYIHGAQIIHRDIKPGNLLLFADERVKLADFGIARSPESITLTMTGLAMGTPEYMSPEQAEGKKDLSIASDIYSLGIVMYELIAGRPPFKRATPLATAGAHLRDPVPPLSQTNPQVSGGLQQIVMKCLEKDPKDRYDSARSLYQEIERYERGEATLGV